MDNSNLSQATQRKQARSEGNGDRTWLWSRGIPDGEFYQGSKPGLRAIMRDSHWTDTARVYACVSLHTLCFGQLLGEGPGPLCAVKLNAGKVETLRPVDIERETGIDRRRVRRAVALLVEWGYLMRNGEDIALWLTPETSVDADVSDDEPEVKIEFPEDLSDDLKRYLRRFRITQLPPASVLAQAKPLCESLVKTEAQLKALLIPEKPDSESTVKAGMKRSKGRTRESSLCREVSDDKPHVVSKKESLAYGVQIERKERKESLSSSSKVVPMPTTTIANELRKHSAADNPGVAAFVVACQSIRADVSEDELCYLIALKAPLAHKKPNPFAYLTRCVKNCLEGDMLDVYRKDRTAERQEREANERRAGEAAAQWEADNARNERADALWSAMSETEQAARIEAAIPEMKTWSKDHGYHGTAQQLREWARNRAIAQIRDTL